MTRQQRLILLVAMVSQGVAVGLTVGIVPVFLEPLEAAFEAPRTSISFGQILIMLSLTASSLVTGPALDKGYARGVMLSGVGLLLVAMVLAAMSTNLVTLALAALLAGAAVPPCGPITAASLVTRNFDEDRGRALGFSSMGPPLGSGLFAGLAGWLLGRFSWDQVFLIFGVIAVVVLLPLIWSIVPARYATATNAEEGDVNMREVVRSPVFLWAGGLFALAAGIVTGWTVHVAAFVAGTGISETSASMVLAVQFWMGVPGALIYGMMADRFSLTKLFVGMLVVCAGILGLFATSPGTWVVAALCVVFGFASSGMIPLYMVLLGQRLGADAIGRSVGLSNLLMLPVMAGSVLFAASAFESSGSYAGALVVFAAGVLASIGCLLGSNREAARRAAKQLGTEVVSA